MLDGPNEPPIRIASNGDQLNWRGGGPLLIVSGEGETLPSEAVIRAGYIEFRAALHTLVAAQQCGTFPIQFFPLCRCEKLLVCIFRRTLQGCVRLIGPDALQIGFAPRRFSPPNPGRR